MNDQTQLPSVGDGKKQRRLFKQGTCKTCKIPLYGYKEGRRDQCGHDDCEVYDADREYAQNANLR
ncbi:MAG: hypothetical protein ACR2QC_07815 [Gammaproteobacteria bacterium]